MSTARILNASTSFTDVNAFKHVIGGSDEIVRGNDRSSEAQAVH